MGKGNDELERGKSLLSEASQSLVGTKFHELSSFGNSSEHRYCKEDQRHVSQANHCEYWSLIHSDGYSSNEYPTGTYQLRKSFADSKTDLVEVLPNVSWHGLNTVHFEEGHLLPEQCPQIFSSEINGDRLRNLLHERVLNVAKKPNNCRNSKNVFE